MTVNYIVTLSTRDSSIRFRFESCDALDFISKALEGHCSNEDKSLAVEVTKEEEECYR